VQQTPLIGGIDRTIQIVVDEIVAGPHVEWEDARYVTMLRCPGSEARARPEAYLTAIAPTIGVAVRLGGCNPTRIAAAQWDRDGESSDCLSSVLSAASASNSTPTMSSVQLFGIEMP
jgi:hypothetical protein